MGVSRVSSVYMFVYIKYLSSGHFSGGKFLAGEVVDSLCEGIAASASAMLGRVHAGSEFCLMIIFGITWSTGLVRHSYVILYPGVLWVL